MVSVLRLVIWTVDSVIFSDDPVKGSYTGTEGAAVGASVEHRGCIQGHMTTQRQMIHRHQNFQSELCIGALQAPHSSIQNTSPTLRPDGDG